MAQASAKGDLALTIDELGLEASLRFTPDPNGAEWTADKLLRLVMDARVGGVNQKRAEDILGRFARSRGETTEILAKGQPPEEPVAEEPEWEDLGPPAGYEALVAAAIASAGEPELYRTRYETMRVEKKVKKPGALPFLPPRIEVVVEQERREIKERIYLDFEVVKTGFAKRGGRIALLSAAKPGKVGKSIFGKPIPPEGKEGVFVLGSGVTRTKNELFAETDGVLRAGSRWVEILPVGLPSWKVSRSSDGATWLLDCSPGDPGLPEPSAADIIQAALDGGAPADSLVSAETVAGIISAARASGESIRARSLSLDRDGRAEVAISPDRTRATLSVWKGRGAGKPLQLAAVTAAIKASGVRVAKVEQFKKDVVDFYRSDRAELLDYVIAEGRAPSRGKDRSVTLNAAFYPDEKTAELIARIAGHPALSITVPSLDDFPVQAPTRLAPVQAGQRFGELSAQAMGAPGVDIAGAVLPGIPGNDPVIRTYENVEFQKGILSASVSGLLFAQEKGGVWSFRVIPFRDSFIEVSMAPDCMFAYISLQSEVGLGRPLTVEGALEAIAAKGVVQGLDTHAVVDAIAAARAGQAVLRRAVAAGKPPRPAGTEVRTWLVGTSAPSKGDRPVGAGPVRVTAGTQILRMSRAAGGPEDGLDVCGRPVPAPPSPEPPAPAAAETTAGPAAAARIEHDASIREESGPDGSVVFVAAAAGELRMDGSRLSVVERFVVRGDVAQETGNVRFAGPVHIHGSVRRGFQLVAGGDAAIAGQVEAALVSSDGAVSIGGGIRGERRGTIRAKKTVEAAFAEQALILAVEDVRVRGNCALCSIKTNGRLFIGTESGSLVGGIVRARKGIEASSLGSANSIKTEISFGQDYLVADMIEAEEREIEKLKALVLQSDRAMAEAERSGAGLDRARQDKVKLVKLIEKRSIRLFDLREKFEEHFSAAEVRVRGTVFPGVILESHNRFYEVRSRKTNVAFSFDQQQGRIVERPL
jgi:hypothetical protein